MAASTYAKLLVLDLDETLIHARGRGAASLPWPPQRQVAHYRVYLRPGVRAFLAMALDSFEAVGIWTAASSEYAAAMLDRIVDRDRLRFVFDRDHCAHQHDAELDERYWVKDITKLTRFGFASSRIMVVDDKPRGLERSYANLVQLRPFLGDPDDRELDALAVYLDELGPVADVRAVDKRGWRLREPATRAAD